MKKNITIAYISLFVVLVCSIHMIFFVCKNHVDTGNYENRPLNQMPNIAVSGLSNYSKEFENFYNDHIPFRNQFIALNNKLCYYLFHSTNGEQVLIGKDGWLFIKDKTQGNAIANYTGEDALNDEELKQLGDNLINNSIFLKEKGIDFVIMISPNKSRVYSEYMPDYLGEPATVYATKQIVDYLRENTDIKVVYDYEALMNSKKELADRGINIYHKVDTHWNNVGAYVGACELLKELGIDMPQISGSDINIEPITNEACDLAGMLHMKEDFVHKENDYEVTGYEMNNVSKVQDDFNEVIEYRSEAADKRCIYISRDSFATAMGTYVGSQFDRTYLRHHDTYSKGDLESVNPDVFVFEVAERSVVYKLSNLNLWN